MRSTLRRDGSSIGEARRLTVRLDQDLEKIRLLATWIALLDLFNDQFPEKEDADVRLGREPIVILAGWAAVARLARFARFARIAQLVAAAFVLRRKPPASELVGPRAEDASARRQSRRPGRP